MAINFAEIGASCSVDADGTLQIKFGLYLPGIRSTDGFGVLVRVIHDADRFDPAVPPRDVAMAWTAGSALDLWTATTTLTPDPSSHYGQDGLYLYRFQLSLTPASGGAADHRMVSRPVCPRNRSRDALGDHLRAAAVGAV
jgi:hypothetical protein